MGLDERVWTTVSKGLMEGRMLGRQVGEPQPQTHPEPTTPSAPAASTLGASLEHNIWRVESLDTHTHPCCSAAAIRCRIWLETRNRQKQYRNRHQNRQTTAEMYMYTITCGSADAMRLRWGAMRPPSASTNTLTSCSTRTMLSTCRGGIVFTTL